MEHTVWIYSVSGYGEEVDEAVEALFAASPRARELGPHTKALIKPNLLAKHVPDHAVTTHPAVVAACIRALQRRGVKRIVVADSPGGLYNSALMRGVYQVSGLADVCRELGAEVYTDCKSGPRETEGKLVRRFELLEPVLEADFIVNVPKFKTHVMTGMSCAVKNLFGTVPGLQKAEFHMRFPEKEPFGNMLVDLCETVRPSLTVVDGVLAMEGDGPAGGTPRPLGLILGGEDPYAIDLTVCGMMGLAPMAVPYLKAVHDRGLCPEKADETWLEGDRAAAAPIADFRLPESYTNINFSNAGKACARPCGDHASGRGGRLHPGVAAAGREADCGGRFSGGTLQFSFDARGLPGQRPGRRVPGTGCRGLYGLQIRPAGDRGKAGAPV